MSSNFFTACPCVGVATIRKAHRRVPKFCGRLVLPARPLHLAPCVLKSPFGGFNRCGEVGVVVAAPGGPNRVAGFLERENAPVVMSGGVVEFPADLRARAAGEAGDGFESGEAPGIDAEHLAHRRVLTGSATFAALE
jgi:hypothetical protein